MADKAIVSVEPRVLLQKAWALWLGMRASRHSVRGQVMNILDLACRMVLASLTALLPLCGNSCRTCECLMSCGSVFTQTDGGLIYTGPYQDLDSFLLLSQSSD